MSDRPPRPPRSPVRSVVEDLLTQVDDLYQLPLNGDPAQWSEAADHWGKLPDSDRDLATMHMGLLNLIALGRVGAAIDRLRVELVKRGDELVDLVEEMVDDDAPDEGFEEEEEPVQAEPVEEEPPPAPPPKKPAPKRERERKPPKAEAVEAEVVEPPPSAAAKADTAAFQHPVR